MAPRYPEERLLMILDGAGWHRESCLNIPASMRLVSLPPYSPELNPVEHIWDGCVRNTLATWFSTVSMLWRSAGNRLVQYGA